MADINYMSPSGMQPKVGWSPDGFLGGAKWQQQERDYKEAFDLQKAFSMFGLTKQKNELDEYGLNSALRDATRRADITKADVTTDTLRREKDLAADKVLADTRHTVAQTGNVNAETAALPGLRKAQTDEINTKNAGARHKQLLDIIGSIAAIRGKGKIELPDSLVLNQHFKELGIDPRSAEAKHIFTDAPNIMQRLSDYDPAQIGKMAQIEATGKWHVSAASAKTPQERADVTMLKGLVEAVEIDPAFKDKPEAVIKQEAMRRLYMMKNSWASPRISETTADKSAAGISGSLLQLEAFELYNKIKRGTASPAEKARFEQLRANESNSPSGSGVPIPGLLPTNQPPKVIKLN